MTLNTPILWVIFPIVVAGIAGIFSKRKVFSVLLTGISALALALLAIFFPGEMQFSIGPLALTFEENLAVLGRQISLPYETLQFVGFIYAMTGLWALSSGTKNVPISFRPSSLVITALLTAAIGVEPFLYAALLIEMAVLVSIPSLTPLEKETEKGTLRYITLQTVAMPFILIAGWLLAGVESLPPDSPLIAQTIIALALGFGLWLGVFPFHTWIPMVSQSSNPTVTSYLMFILPTSVLVFSLKFLDGYTFLRTSETFFELLRIIGTLTIIMGGVFTAVQDNLKRAFGFSVLSETGFSLLALGVSPQVGLSWMLMLFPVRALGYWLWGYTLNLIEEYAGAVDYANLQGFARHYPFLSGGLLVSQLSIAGLPLLAGFPIKSALIATTFEYGGGLAVWSFIGSLGLFLFTFRLIGHLVTPEDDPDYPAWMISEKTHEYLPVVIMTAVLIILGLFPGEFLSGILETLTAFAQLQ